MKAPTQTPDLSFFQLECLYTSDTTNKYVIVLGTSHLNIVTAIIVIIVHILAEDYNFPYSAEFACRHPVVVPLHACSETVHIASMVRELGSIILVS